MKQNRPFVITLIVVALALFVVYHFFGSSFFDLNSLNSARPVSSNGSIQALDDTPAVVQPETQEIGDGGAVASQTLLDGALIIQDVVVGSGRVVERGSVVSLSYVGVLENTGEVFDQGTIPQVEAGGAGFIQGFSEGIVGMKEGGRRILILAPEVAYGDRGIVNPSTGETVIPPNASLVFQVEIVSVE